MNTPWILQTRGDPIQAIHLLLIQLWRRVRLDGLIAPRYQEQTGQVSPHLFNSPRALAAHDLFAPMEVANAAKSIVSMARTRPRGRYAAILRPCEMRALQAMVRRDGFQIDRWLLISIDCLGAYPGEDTLWRARHAGSMEQLSSDLMKNAPQGGIAAYRFRDSCQMCLDSHAIGGDLTISLLGLPVRDYVFVTAGESPLAQKVGVCALTHGPANNEQIARRERIIERVRRTHRKSRQRITDGLGPDQPRTVGELIAMFAWCSPCEACLESCPIYLDELAPLRSGGSVSSEQVTRWVAFCAQCGVCREACPTDRPVATIIGRIRENLNRANPSLAI
jgi:formate dehydrogenase subunit beta